MGFPPLAFIFASRADAKISRQCAARLEKQGIEARVIADAAEGAWPADCPPDRISRFPRGGRLKGTQCAAGIAQFMAGYWKQSGDRVLMKVDADTALSLSAARWLAECPAGEARGLRVGPWAWSGIWAAHRSAVATAGHLLARGQCADCPEARLTHLAFLSFLQPVVWMHAMGVWSPGRAWPPAAPAVTLPTSMRGNRRDEAAAGLFATEF
jgi:hypothetical protein